MSATLGHNGGSGITDSEYLSLIGEGQRLKRDIAEASGRYRAFMKRAKANGANIKAVRTAITAATLDPEEVARDLRDTIRVLALRNFPVYQTDMFGEGGLNVEVSDQVRDADNALGAEFDGYRAGRGNVPLEDNPCEPESDLHKAWAKGWQDGQTAIAIEMGANAKLANPSRSKLGRPRGRPRKDQGLLEGPAAPKRRGRPPGRKAAPEAEVPTIN
jgi:hypothetical protein